MSIYRFILLCIFALTAIGAYETKKEQSKSGVSTDVIEQQFEIGDPYLANTTNNSKSEKLKLVQKIRSLLNRKQYDKLNNILESYEEKIVSDISAEDDLFAAYNAIALRDSSYIQLFTKWIEATPDRYPPYLARANYHIEMGWAARGHKWASETSKEQMEEMHNRLALAASDLEAAKKINNHSMFLYSLKLTISNITGDDEMNSKIAEAAISQYPASFNLRARYMKSLEPRWGGSFDKMIEFAGVSQTYVARNNKLKLLLGRPLVEAGKLQATADKHNVAVTLHTKALTFGEDELALFERGKSHYWNKNYRLALEDLNRAVEIAPTDAEIYYWRSKAQSRLKHYNKAKNDIDLAIRLKPNIDYFERHRKSLSETIAYNAYQIKKSGQADKAIAQYDSALQLDPDNAANYYRRAHAAVELNKLNEALDDVKRAIELEPNDINYYLLLDWILAQTGNWDEIISYWDQFIELHPDNGRAYVERGGAFYRKGDVRSAVENAKISANLGNPQGKQAYEKFKHLVER